MKTDTDVTEIEHKGVLNSTRVSFLEISNDIPFEEHLYCEACDRELSVLTVLSSNINSKHVRVGVCNHCGYRGYMDRPTKKWMISYYSKDWDQEFARSVGDIRSNTELVSGKIKGSRRTSFELHKKLDVNKRKPLLDVGSGYGQVLQNFENAGFTKLVGVENSISRARKVHEAFGYDILEGDFGNPEVTAKLKEWGSFGVIFSHHVLEHTYSPKQIIRAMGELQEVGDALILALPNCAAEHILYQMFYLPHLHGFTRESLELLLNVCGYELRVNDVSHDTSIVFGAVKVQEPQPILSLKNEYFISMSMRLNEALKLRVVQEGDLYELFWQQKPADIDYSNHTVITAKQKNFYLLLWVVRSVYWHVSSRYIKRFKSGYNMLFYYLKNVEMTPVVIRFSGPILMMIK